MRKFLVVLAASFAVLAVPTPSQAQMCCDFDFSEMFDLKPAGGLGWAVNNGGAPSLTVKTMVFRLGKTVSMVGAGAHFAMFPNEGLGNKFLLTLVPLTIGNETWYVAGEVTPYSVGRTRVLERSGNVTVTERKEYGPALLVTLNIRF